MPPAPVWLVYFDSTLLLLNLVVKGVMEMEVSIPVSILAWIFWEKLNSLPRPAILRISKSEITIYNSEVPDTTGRKKQQEVGDDLSVCVLKPFLKFITLQILVVIGLKIKEIYIFKSATDLVLNMSRVALMVRASHGKSAPSLVWCLWILYKWICNVFNKCTLPCLVAIGLVQVEI